MLVRIDSMLTNYARRNHEGREASGGCEGRDDDNHTERTP